MMYEFAPDLRVILADLDGKCAFGYDAARAAAARLWSYAPRRLADRLKRDQKAHDQDYYQSRRG